MRILIIRNIPSYMAVRDNTYNIQEVGLAKALIRKGHTCDIVFWTDKCEEMVEIPVCDCGVIHVFYRHGTTKLRNTVFVDCGELFARYDILQPCEYNQIQAWLLAKKQSCKTVIYHGPYSCSFNKRYNLMCKFFDAIFLKQYTEQGTKFLVKSNMAKEFLVNKGIQPSNIRVVGVGIDVEMLSSGKDTCDEKFILQMKEDTDNPKILYIGRFEERRNIFFIFDIFDKLLHQCPKAKLYLIGTGKPDYVIRAFDYARKLGFYNRIVWQEKMEQKYLSNVYELADFFLLPTEYEIFGMVLLEAMYYENVVLTTKNGGSSTLIENGKNGFILDNLDSNRWANCINEIYENKNRMKEIRQNASLRIMEHFTWDMLADKFIEAYQSKIGEN